GPGRGVTPNAHPGPPPAHPAPRSTAPRTPPAPPAPGPAPDASPAPSGGSPCTAPVSGPTRAARAGRRPGSPGRRGGTRPASGRSASPGTGWARTSAHGSPCPGILIAPAPGRHGSGPAPLGTVVRSPESVRTVRPAVGVFSSGGVRGSGVSQRDGALSSLTPDHRPLFKRRGYSLRGA